MKLRCTSIFTKISFMRSACKFVPFTMLRESDGAMNGTTQNMWWYGPARNWGSNKDTLEYKVCCNRTVKFTQTGHVNTKRQGTNPPYINLNYDGTYPGM
jgi:hypothetical protein